MTTRDGAQAPNPSRPVGGQQSGDPPGPDRTAAVDDEGPIEIELDFIDEALEETMIASDPPAALTPETAIGPPAHGRDKDGSRRD